MKGGGTNSGSNRRVPACVPVLNVSNTVEGAALVLELYLCNNIRFFKDLYVHSMEAFD